jgi:hypothetical protein
MLYDFAVTLKHLICDGYYNWQSIFGILQETKKEKLPVLFHFVNSKIHQWSSLDTHTIFQWYWKNWTWHNVTICNAVITVHGKPVVVVHYKWTMVLVYFPSTLSSNQASIYNRLFKTHKQKEQSGTYHINSYTEYYIYF